MANFIIHQHAKQYQWKGDCFLSLKSFYNGKANYQIGQRNYQVTATNFLLLNECTDYQLTIDSQQITESFCVFFDPVFVTKTITELAATDEQLLDLNVKTVNGWNWIERNYPQKGLVRQILQTGKTKMKQGMSILEKEEFYYQLLYVLIGLNEATLLEANQLVAKKNSTRIEIYQRIYHAKDFIDSHFTEELSLKKIAQVALLSENHFLRNFSQIIGISPFRYISNLRIEEAKRQILTTDKPIQAIARSLGYVSMSNFSHYFKAKTGYAPSILRKGDI